MPGVTMFIFECTIMVRCETWWLMRRAAFAAGFRDYVETGQLVKDLPPLSEIIRAPHDQLTA